MRACETRRALRQTRRLGLPHPSVALGSVRPNWVAGHDAAREGSQAEAQWAQRSSGGRRARQACGAPAAPAPSGKVLPAPWRGRALNSRESESVGITH